MDFGPLDLGDELIIKSGIEKVLVWVCHTGREGYMAHLQPQIDEKASIVRTLLVVLQSSMLIVSIYLFFGF